MYNLFIDDIKLAHYTLAKLMLLIITCCACVSQNYGSCIFNINILLPLQWHHSTGFVVADFCFKKKMMRLHFSRVVVHVYSLLQISPPAATSLRPCRGNLWPRTVSVSVLYKVCVTGALQMVTKNNWNKKLYCWCKQTYYTTQSFNSDVSVSSNDTLQRKYVIKYSSKVGLKMLLLPKLSQEVCKSGSIKYLA